MPKFVLFDEDGAEYEWEGTLDEVELLPPIDGKYHPFMGKSMMRPFSRVQSPLGVKERHFISRSLPFNYKYHAEMGGDFDKEGRCRFDSWEQVSKTVKHANEHGENVIYDDAREIT